MTDLPSSWVSVSLESVSMRVTKGTTPTTNGYRFQEQGIAFVKVENLSNGRIDPKSITDFISTEADQAQARSSLKANDILFSIAGTIGRTAIVRDRDLPANTNQALAIITCEIEAIYPPYLEHLLKSHVAAETVGRARGGAMNNISLADLKETTVPLPPLNEQRRIVEKIEAMFDEIDKGVESLQTARITLGLYRQSLLKSAFEGRLTADWRAQNADKLEAPETLLARIRSERDTRYKAALEAWQESLAQWRAAGENGKKPAKPKRPADLDPKSGITLGHVVLDVAQGWSPKCDNHASHADEAWGVIKTTAIQPAKFLPQENKELPKDLQPREWLELNDGDVLITRAGPRTRVGVACMVKRTRPRLMLCDKAYRLNYLETLVLPEFLEAYLNAPDTQWRIEVIKSGINDSGLNLKQEQFLALEFWLPSIAEQAKIVRILDARLEAADALKAEIDAALTRADALRQSILKKAFSSHLVPQDPNDEPASALLERIKAERLDLANGGRPKKARTTKLKETANGV